MPTHAELAKIHIAKRDLKLTDPLYRGFLNVLFGQGSERDLTQEQVEELLEHFKSLGWKSEYTKSEMGRKQSEPKAPPPSHGSGRKPATMAQIGLIVYLWEHGPGIRHKSMQALEHFLNHHFHIAELKQVKARQVPGILGAIKNMGKM
ncbi:MAG: regulatory protein GemA [Nitrospinota bacterium]|nr:regulatory protein GemA [Nitrospinota bacterium]